MHPVQVGSDRRSAVLVSALALLGIAEAIFAQALLAQALPTQEAAAAIKQTSIIPSTGPAGTGTVATPRAGQPSVYDVTEGALSGGTSQNLFHQFQQLNVGSGDTVNFVTPENVQNIINLIEDSNPSLLDGLLQVADSNANLYLVNPNGVIFGDTAQLNISGSLFVSTADSLLFDSQNLDVSAAASAYTSLAGEPTGYIFSTATPGPVTNNANLSVNPGESITFLGGTVQNNGTLSTPSGNINLAAVPGEGVVRLSQVNNLLSLEIAPLDTPALENEVSLPSLLTGGAMPEATQIVENSEGTVALIETVDLTQPGSVVSGGTLDTSGVNGGDINFLGVQIALLGAELRTDGELSGGSVYIGGIPESTGLDAAYVFVDRDSKLSAAGQAEAGGTVYVWSEEQTFFYGQVDTSGATANGEVSIDSDGTLEWFTPPSR